MIPKELFEMMGKSGGKVAIGGLPFIVAAFMYIYMDSKATSELVLRQAQTIHRLDSCQTALKVELKTTKEYFTQSLNNFIDCETDKDKLENELLQMKLTMNRYGVPYISKSQKNTD